MSRIKGGSGKGSFLGAWDIAATLGLVTVAFIVERTAAADNAKPALPPKEGRHASTAGLASEDGNRGRDAESPSDIPANGWKDILWRVYGNVSDHRILALAAGMTYYSILAIFPALAALVAIYGLFTDPASIAKHLDVVSGFIPGGAAEVAREQLTRVASKGGSTLGFTFAIGLIISLWSANAAMKALFDTLNIVYGEQEKRSFLKLNAMSLGFTLAGIAFILSALAAVVVIPIILEYLGLLECRRSPDPDRALAGNVPCPRDRPLLHLPLRTEPRSAALEMDHMGQRSRDDHVDCGLCAVFLLRCELRDVQRNLWLAGRGHRFHDVALDFGDSHIAWR